LDIGDYDVRALLIRPRETEEENDRDRERERRTERDSEEKREREREGPPLESLSVTRRLRSLIRT